MKEAIHWLEFAASRGDLDAARIVNDYKKEKKSASSANPQWNNYLERLEVKAKQGDGEALFELGKRYYQGDSVPQNLPKAREYFEKAVNLGITSAETGLALCEISLTDEVKGIGRLLRAVARGDSMAKAVLEGLKKAGCVKELSR